MRLELRRMKATNLMVLTDENGKMLSGQLNVTTKSSKDGLRVVVEFVGVVFALDKETE